MRRLYAIAATTVILLLTFAPAALAADPVYVTGHGAVVAVNGTVNVPEGQSIDAAVVVDGTGTIAGTVDTVVVVHGTVTLTGATARHLVVVDGAAVLGAGTTITGDISTLRGTVTQDPNATVTGRYTTLDTNLTALAVLLIPLILVVTVGFGLAMIAAGLVLAAFGSRQTRAAGALITRQPLKVFAVGIAGSVALPVISGLLIATIIGAPIGLAGLFLVMPALALLGWLVAAILVGDWLLGNLRGASEAGRPYRAAVIGVVVLALAGVVPLVSTVATILGFGALLLAAWHTVRPQPAGPVTAPAAPAGWGPSAASAS